MRPRVSDTEHPPGADPDPLIEQLGATCWARATAANCAPSTSLGPQPATHANTRRKRSVLGLLEAASDTHGPSGPLGGAHKCYKIWQRLLR